jgi:hypothetical protein
MTPNLHQDLTYWTVSADGFGGYSFGVPKTLKGRWEDKSELFTSGYGKEMVSKAIVYLDTDVTLDGYLMLGTTTVADPTTLPGAYQVAAFRKVPNLGAVRFERKAYL